MADTSRDTITLRVTRWRPDKNTPPGPQDYDVPLRKDWTVLDGLNHIKNEIDQTLAFRWSCRMGICGSCGMNVDGEPRLTCGAFLTDYAPGPVMVEPLANFPIARDLIVDMSDFMEKLPRVKPWIIRDDDVTEIDGEYLQTPEELDAYKQFSMCINCMLCYAACPIYGLDPDFIGPAAIALAERYDLDSRDSGPASGSTYSSSTKACGDAPSSASAPGSAPSTWTRPVPSSATSSRRPSSRSRRSSCRGACDERPHLAAARLHLVVAAEAHLLRVRDEGAQLAVRGLVRGLPAAARPRGHPGRRGVPRFLHRADSPVLVVINVIGFVFIVLHTVTWFSVTPQAMAPQFRGKPVPAPLVIGAQYAGLVVVSAFIWWLVTR
jgi:fumarate reductase iron-sulfur subunit